MHNTVVINVVGLTPRLLGEHTPYLLSFAERGRLATVAPVLPAVTSTAHATYLTGAPPEGHGVVANGWYFREECEVKFWRQSNRLVEGPKVWDKARQIDPSFTCANLFWWFNMYSSVDYAVTPRPMYPADGRKIPDVYTKPAGLRHALQSELGQFPLFEFWGPNSSISSSRWISGAARRVDTLYNPTLTLVYLPHLDYNLQKLGPEDGRIAEDLRRVDAVFGDLLNYYDARGTRVMVVSEYGITPASKPVHLNRILRKNGLIAVRDELGREMLDAGESGAFAVADHQISHVYVKDAEQIPRIKALLRATDGVAEVLDKEGKKAHRLDHPRSGELVAVAEPGAWFTYYYWLDDERAPDFSRTVDIHRKPGFDPVELFVDPKIRYPKAKVGTKLLRKRLGFRYLMDVVPLDASLVKGTHGRPPDSREDAPLLITQQTELVDEKIDATDVHALILRHLLAT